MQALDITSFDAVADSDGGFEFELLGTDGMTGTGVYVTVLGRHADAVVAWGNKVFNATTRETQMAARKGKMVEPKTLDELRDQNIEGAVIRVTGWRNVAQDYTAELMKKTLLRNPHWLGQIVEQSENLANFTK